MFANKLLSDGVRSCWNRIRYIVPALIVMAVGILLPASVKRVRQAVGNRRGEGFVDTAVKVLMAVVIGALVLAGLYLLFKDTILPELTRRINEMFNYNGS